MKQDFNIGEIIVAAADRYSGRVAFKLTDGTVSFGQFRDMIFSHASRMRALGVNRDSCVGIDIASPPSQLCIALACALLGCRWVHASKEARASKIVGMTHLIHTGAKAPLGSAISLVLDRSWLPARSDIQRPEFEGFASPSSAWMIMQSSGTTGSSKFMALTATAIPIRIEVRPYIHLGSDTPVLASLMHHLSTFGLSNALKVLSLGGTVVASVDLPFLLAAGVNTVIGSPSQVLGLCEKRVDRRIRCVILGGSLITDEFLDRIFEKFELVENNLGCAEIGIIAINHVSIGGNTNRLSVGRVLPTCVAEIVDKNDRLLPVNTEGILRARSATPITGYLGGEAPEMVRDGWFYTGDLATLSATGELTITGRVNDVVNFGGTKLNAAAIDEVVLTTEGVKDGVCFAQSGFSLMSELGILLVPKLDDEAESVVSKVQANLLAKFGRKGLAQRIYVANVIPRNSGGKVSREEIAKLLAQASPFATQKGAS